MTVYTILSADKKTFKVGCDCVAKTYRQCAKTSLERSARLVHDQVNKIKTATANARKDARIQAAKTQLENHRVILATLGSIMIAGRSRPALEYLDWMFEHAGRTGKLRAAAELERLLLAVERHKAAIHDDSIRHERDARFSTHEVDFVNCPPK